MTTTHNIEIKDRNRNEYNNIQLENMKQDLEISNNTVKNLKEVLEEVYEININLYNELKDLLYENKKLHLDYQNALKEINEFNSLKIQNETLINEMKQILNFNSIKTLLENNSNELLKQINERNMKLYNEFIAYHHTNILNQKQNQINSNTEHHQTQNNNSPMEYNKDNSISKKSTISNSPNNNFEHFLSSSTHHNQITSTNKETKYKLYYFSEDMEYFNTIKGFFEMSPVFIQGIDESIVLNVEKGSTEGVVEGYDGSKLLALYSIFISGSRCDWNKYKNLIENLEKKNYDVALVLIRCGKNATPYYFQNFIGTQINLKTFRYDVYHDDFNMTSLKTLCKSIHQSK